MTKELAGPTNFEMWQASFRVCRTAMVMLNITPLAHLNAYETHLDKMVRFYPGCWHLRASGRQSEVRAPRPFEAEGHHGQELGIRPGAWEAFAKQFWRSCGEVEGRLNQLVGTKPGPAVKLIPQGVYITPANVPLIKAWSEKGGDPETEAQVWLEEGAPLGIEKEIKTCRIFPLSDEGRRNRASRTQQRSSTEVT